MKSVFLVYVLQADGSIDLQKVCSTEEKAKKFIEGHILAQSLYYDEEDVD